MKHLFVTDLDGTLLNGDSRVSERSSAIISELSRHGVPITVATARTPATVVPILSHTHTSLPAIVMTGAALWDREHNRYVSTRPFAPELDEEVMASIRECGIEPLRYTFTDTDPLLHVYCNRPLSEATEAFIRDRKDATLKEFHIDEACPASAQTMLYFAMGPRANVFAAADRLRERGDCSVSAFTDIFGPDTGILEVFASGVDKASAITALKKQVGADRVTVYGDNLNDLPMMAVADDAVAVANALPEVKEAANRVIGYNTADAVALDIAAHYPEIITADLLKRL